MKRLIVPAVIAVVLSLSACSTGGSNEAAASRQGPPSTQSASTPTPEPVEVPDLSGSWKQNNSKSDDGWVAATIADGVVTVDFVTDGGDTTSLFWVGTFTPPTDDASPYTWTSTRDEAATETALLASTDPTKEFTYDSGEISFPVSIAGSSATVRMSKN